MYKVFVNDSVIKFTKEQDFEGHEALVYSETADFAKLMMDLENSNEVKTKTIAAESLETTWSEFVKHFKIIEAAGGIVWNDSNEILFIHRLGKWDLPKGKIEKGEKIKEAAIREVEEECGVNGLQIVKQLPDTYHTYKLNGVRVLKRTYWFEMKTNFKDVLIPQLEEDITQVQWVAKKNADSYVNNTYASIAWLLTEYFKS